MVSKKTLRNLIFLFILSSGQLYSLSPLDQALIDAALNDNDNVEAAKNLIEQGANVNTQTEDTGKTPLHFSSTYGDEEMTRMLLSKGALTEIKDQSGKTPLITASQFGREPIVNILIEHKANVNATDKEEKTSLMHASRSGYSNIVRKLLINEADPKLKNKFGATALTMATKTHDPSIEVVRLLLEYDAEPTEIEEEKRIILASELPEPYKGHVYKIIPGIITNEKAKELAQRQLQEQLKITQEEAENIVKHEVLPLLPDYPKQNTTQRIIDMTINRLRAQRTGLQPEESIIKTLPSEQYLDLNEKESFTQETFKKLIEHATSNNPYFISEVITSDDDRKFYNFFDANELKSYILQNNNVLNPLNKLPIEKINTYKISSLESEFERAPILETTINDQFLFSKLDEYADETLNNLAYWLKDYIKRKERGLKLTMSQDKIQEFAKKAIQILNILKNQDINLEFKESAIEYLNKLEPLKSDIPEPDYKSIYNAINGDSRIS